MTAILIRDLCKSYGKHKVLDQLNMRVEPGQIYGFLGENGAGKTTTIRLLTGLLRPAQGSIELLGQPLAENRQSLLAQLGALIESPAFYAHLSGRANLDLLRRLRKLPAEVVDDALAAVNLTQAADRRAKTYSHGMKQRLGIAAALLGRPKLVILDEPTNGLDPAGIRAMRELIRGLPERWGSTVLLSSHLLSEVEQTATHVGMLHGGRLVFEGSLDDLHARAQPKLRLRTQQREQALACLAEFSAEPGDEPDVVWLPDRDDQAAAVQQALAAAGIVVREMTSVRPNLESLYFQLTGEEQHADRASA